MPGEAAERRKMTAAEYRAMERVAVEKHVLWNGEVFAMAGASLAHNQIVAALVAALYGELRGGECNALPSDMRVWIPSADGYVYPDVTVACAPLDVERIDGLETLRNPRVIVEVLSESTEAFDRGDKFAGYRSIASLIDYILVSSVRRELDHFTRQPDGSWTLRSYRGDDVLTLSSVPATLKLADVYERAQPI